jgi:hypothetical protein
MVEIEVPRQMFVDMLSLPGCGHHLRQHEGAKGSNLSGDGGKGVP